MARRRVLLAALAGALLPRGNARAQAPPPTGRVPRVAFIAAAYPATIAPRVDAFRAGLQERGYVEGRSLVVDYLFAEEQLDRLPALVAQALERSPEVVVSAGPSVTRAVLASTRSVPVVMAFDPDPVGAGFVASLARPGGNVTGLSSIGAEMASKQLEMLKLAMPALKRAAVIGNSSEPGDAPSIAALKAAAPRLGIVLVFGDVRGVADIEPAFRQAARANAQAAVVLSSPLVTFHAPRFAEHALEQRMPAVFPYPDVVEAGGLMHYGVSTADLFRRAAGYVDRILRGAKPAELPVEQPSRFDLVVNLRAARRLGLGLPADVLARADRVID